MNHQNGGRIGFLLAFIIGFVLLSTLLNIHQQHDGAVTSFKSRRILCSSSWPSSFFDLNNKISHDSSPSPTTVIGIEVPVQQSSNSNKPRRRERQHLYLRGSSRRERRKLGYAGMKMDDPAAMGGIILLVMIFLVLTCCCRGLLCDLLACACLYEMCCDGGGGIGGFDLM